MNSEVKQPVLVLCASAIVGIAIGGRLHKYRTARARNPVQVSSAVVTLSTAQIIVLFCETEQMRVRDSFSENAHFRAPHVQGAGVMYGEHRSSFQKGGTCRSADTAFPGEAGRFWFP